MTTIVYNAYGFVAGVHKTMRPGHVELAITQALLPGCHRALVCVTARFLQTAACTAHIFWPRAFCRKLEAQDKRLFTYALFFANRAPPALGFLVQKSIKPYFFNGFLTTRIRKRALWVGCTLISQRTRKFANHDLEQLARSSHAITSQTSCASLRK